MGKVKTRGLPTLPTDDIMLHGDQIDHMRLKNLRHDLALPGDPPGDDHAACWSLLVALADGRMLRITFTGAGLDVFQQIEGPAGLTGTPRQ